MIKEIAKLQNNIEYIYKRNKNTPRVALCLNMSINKEEEKPGIYSLVARLLLQGTKNYNSEELANEFEKYAIDFSCELFPNYLRLRFVCLNEDIKKAIELTDDVIKNSTFEEWEKEKLKLSGEITAELDSPRAKAMDSYCKTIFENHYYGNSMTKVLENLDNITKEDIINAYKNILNNSRKSLAIVGDLPKEEVLPLIENSFGTIASSTEENFEIKKPELNEIKQIENIKQDLNQAHIIKGWLVPTLGEEDHATLILLNIMLGACGLSSRLFTELRDKKGLAYVVRSSYETFKLIGHFLIYIATEPKNIDISLKGFNEEIEKICTIPVSEEELNNAKNNFMGKCAFLNETNMQQACLYAKFGVLGFGFEYSEELKQKVQSVTPEQILSCAQKCFNENYVISIIKP